MAIAYVTRFSQPATDGAAEGDSNVTFAPSGISAGDFVLVYLYSRAAINWSIVNGGGQSWSSSANTAANGTHRLFWCVFDGTWDANLEFDEGGVGSNTGIRIGRLVAFSGVDAADPWDVDPVIASQASSTTFVTADYNTATDGAWALVGGGSNDDNQWSANNSFVAEPGSGNVYWRSGWSTDASIYLARKEIASAGAVGATTLTQTANGADSGGRWYGALKPAAPPAAAGRSQAIVII